MDKVNILASSKMDPAGPLSQQQHATIISQMSPTLAYIIHFQNIIGSFSVFLCWRAYLLASVSLARAVWATRLLAFYAFVGTKLGALQGATAIVALWDMKMTRTLRDKLFHEFALFILGAGNGIFLLVLWPGWVVLGGAIFLWQMCG